MRCSSCDEAQPGEYLAHVGREAVAACQSVASTGRPQYVMITPARQRAVAGNSSPQALLSLPFGAVHNK